MYSFMRFLWHLIGMGQELHPCGLVELVKVETEDGPQWVRVQTSAAQLAADVEAA